MYKILVTAFVLFVVIRLYRRYRDGQLSARRAIFWLLLWVGVAAVVWAPWTADYVSSLMGTERAVDLFLFFAILFLVYGLFTVYVRLELMRQQMTTLVRELALRDLEQSADQRSSDPPV